MTCPSETDAAVFQQLRPRLEAISLRIVGSLADAQDVVQDCFLKWEAAEKTALLVPAAWLTTVVRHQSLDRLRKRARDERAAHTAMALLPGAPPLAPEDGLLRRAELEQGLARMLACLSPAERMTLVLHEVFECDHASIAKLLGTSPVNARQHLARARRRLRDHASARSAEEKRSRELIQRFHAAINGMDMVAMLSLLSDPQPMAVHLGKQASIERGICANEAAFSVALAA
ncbi:MAG: sigma-70 family RNA polymerase sigma factor [Massilia sp.]